MLSLMGPDFNLGREVSQKGIESLHVTCMKPESMYCLFALYYTAENSYDFTKTFRIRVHCLEGVPNENECTNCF